MACILSTIYYFIILIDRNVKNIETLIIKVGTVFRNDENAQSHFVDYLAIHPNYDPNLKSNDIGLIRLKVPILYNNVIRPICLPEVDLDNAKLMSYRHCVISGFGWTDGGSKF